MHSRAGVFFLSLPTALVTNLFNLCWSTLSVPCCDEKSGNNSSSHWQVCQNETKKKRTQVKVRVRGSSSGIGEEGSLEMHGNCTDRILQLKLFHDMCRLLLTFSGNVIEFREMKLISNV